MSRSTGDAGVGGSDFTWSHYTYLRKRGRSSVGRTPALHAGGREFNSPRLHLEAKNCFLKLKLVSIGFKLYELSVFLSCLNSLGIKLKT